MFLIGNRIAVIHVISEKPVADSSIAAIDLLINPVCRDCTEWLYARVTPDKFRKAFKSAPARTSIHGHGDVPYFHLQRSVFSVLKRLGGASMDVKNRLLSGIDKR
jgi:hypothetical protein